MNNTFDNHLQDVYKYIEANDSELALRRLTDCAFETRNTEIFRNTLAYYEWLEGNKTADNATKNAKAFALLETIKNVGLSAQPQTGSQKILSVTQVGKAYQKSGFKISNLNFSLHERQITGLVGENGNGKTTLLRLLAAELKPDFGTIDYNFTDTKDTYTLKTKLIYIEQRIPRWYGTLMDNLHFVLPYYGLKGEENQLWADLMIARLGLRPYRHLTWGRISSGYRTRFELAKTLLRSPKILLLDEPLANLDIISQQTILQDLKYMANSITAPFGMILSSQHIYEVEKVSDNIIFIKNGIAQYQNNTAASEGGVIEKQHNGLLLEVEVNCTRDQLVIAFANMALQKIQFNGGVYLLHFDEKTTVSTVLNAMASNAIEPGYFRNISQSSRRFFIN